MCGRTPVDHKVVLEVSLRIPAEWGGANDPENLWPLCQDCHQGRRKYLQTFAPYESQISRAASLDEPQRRIGELLKAFKGDWVSSELIGVVASAREYQEDFQRRIRDLRYLGWKIEQQKRYHEGARVKSYYRLVYAAPWPDNIRTAIVAEEKRRQEAREHLPRLLEACVPNAPSSTLVQLQLLSEYFHQLHVRQVAGRHFQFGGMQLSCAPRTPKFPGSLEVQQSSSELGAASDRHLDLPPGPYQQFPCRQLPAAARPCAHGWGQGQDHRVCVSHQQGLAQYRWPFQPKPPRLSSR